MAHLHEQFSQAFKRHGRKGILDSMPKIVVEFLRPLDERTDLSVR